ncbi:TadE/TadG family type IV pilus assembly protein [Actinomadura rupiterrae]|uniref:TadE/TadG family type IV pilus assembly protein n=1 Tax=Actinomadura rupiterrae TaxID=559627 RepID=UPI0020A39B03|nr:Tad domain-containing protein [Actinomadura rupiterrae]MCP2335427.1 Flp pilus assembly protein TadG [Actinomadura rupiterrae]
MTSRHPRRQRRRPGHGRQDHTRPARQRGERRYALFGRLRDPAERDRGTITLYIVLFTPAVFVLAGLLLDGGRAIHARQRAADMAEQAARAGANQIDTATLRDTGKVQIDTLNACASAYSLLDDYGQQVDARNCDPTPNEVRVSVQITVHPQLLGIIPGMGEFHMSSNATAHPVTADNPR